MGDLDRGFDIVIIGAGLAGAAAALRAAESGASVCLLEKGESFGGSSVKAGGGFLFAGTDLQSDAGIEDDAEALRETIFESGHHANDPAVVAAYVDNQLDAYEWLRDHGITFSLAPTFDSSEIRRVHAAPPAAVTCRLMEKFIDLERSTYSGSSSVSRLHSEAGAVDGVNAEVGGSEVTVKARSVILATGGFARSRELLQTFAPKWSDAVKMGGAHSTGDGLRMAWKLGAGLADMGYVEASFGASVAYPAKPHAGVETAEEPRLLYANTRGAIIVNLEGRRFVNEMLDYKALGEACTHQPSGLAVQVFDETVMSRSRATPVTADFATALTQGHVIKAGSLSELAEMLEMDPGVLQGTVTTYNENAERGGDPEFGRPIASDSDGGALLDSPPFYAYPCGTGLTTTYCGLRVDERLQVIDVFGEQIHGLFAAGEVVGGFHGAGYLTGTGLGKAAVFGYAAGSFAGK